MGKTESGLSISQTLFKDQVLNLLGNCGRHGNARHYVWTRLRRDAPEAAREWLHKVEVLADAYYAADDADARAKAKREFDSHYRTMRAVAKKAGVISEPDNLERLMRAWDAANLEERRAFLALCATEIEAAEEGELIVFAPPSRVGPAPYGPAEGAEIPDLEALLKADMSVSEVARHLGVSYRTVCRWRSGKTKPSSAILEKLST